MLAFSLMHTLLLELSVTCNLYTVFSTSGVGAGVEVGAGVGAGVRDGLGVGVVLSPKGAAI